MFGVQRRVTVATLCRKAAAGRQIRSVKWQGDADASEDEVEQRQRPRRMHHRANDDGGGFS